MIINLGTTNYEAIIKILSSPELENYLHPNLTLRVHEANKAEVLLAARVITSGKCPINTKIKYFPEICSVSRNSFTSILCEALRSGKCPEGLYLDLSRTRLVTELTGFLDLEMKCLGRVLQSGNCPKNLTIDLSSHGVGSLQITPLFQALGSGNCPEGLSLKLQKNGFSEMSDLLAAFRSGNCPKNLSIDLSEAIGIINGLNDLPKLIASGEIPEGLTLNLSHNSIEDDIVRALIIAMESKNRPLGCRILLSNISPFILPSSISRFVLESNIPYFIDNSFRQERLREIDQKILNERLLQNLIEGLKQGNITNTNISMIILDYIIRPQKKLRSCDLLPVKISSLLEEKEPQSSESERLSICCQPEQKDFDEYTLSIASRFFPSRPKSIEYQADKTRCIQLITRKLKAEFPNIGKIAYTGDRLKIILRGYEVKILSFQKTLAALGIDSSLDVRHYSSYELIIKGNNISTLIERFGGKEDARLFVCDKQTWCSLM